MSKDAIPAFSKVINQLDAVSYGGGVHVSLADLHRAAKRLGATR